MRVQDRIDYDNSDNLSPPPGDLAMVLYCEENPMPPVVHKPRIEALNHAIQDLLDAVKDHEDLQEQARIAIVSCKNRLQQQRLTLDLTGKRALSTVDAFVKPTYLTSKRRLGLVDKYHGAGRGKRVQMSPFKSIRRPQHSRLQEKV